MGDMGIMGDMVSSTSYLGLVFKSNLTFKPLDLMKRVKKIKEHAEIDMAPLIDMVFLLLIFFMCSATLSEIEYTPDVQLPVAPRAKVPEDLKNRGVINILSDGDYMIASKIVTEKQMLKIMKQRRKQNPELKLYLRANKEVPFKKVKIVLKTCAEAGINDIIFASFQSPNH